MALNDDALTGSERPRRAKPRGEKTKTKGKLSLLDHAGLVRGEGLVCGRGLFRWTYLTYPLGRKLI